MDMVKVLNVDSELNFRKPRAGRWLRALYLLCQCPSQPGRARDCLSQTSWPVSNRAETLAAVGGAVWVVMEALQPGRPSRSRRAPGSKQQKPAEIVCFKEIHQRGSQAQRITGEGWGGLGKPAGSEGKFWAQVAVLRHSEPCHQATGLTLNCPSQDPHPCPGCLGVGERVLPIREAGPGPSSVPSLTAPPMWVRVTGCGLLPPPGLPTPDWGARRRSSPGLTLALPWPYLELLFCSGPQSTHLLSGGDGAQADQWFLNYPKELIQRFGRQWMCWGK